MPTVSGNSGVRNQKASGKMPFGDMLQSTFASAIRISHNQESLTFDIET